MSSEVRPVPAHPFHDHARDAVYRAIFTRRDVRNQFLPDAVDDSTIARLLLAAHHAPSVGFMQPWSFLVVRDRDTRSGVKEVFAQANAEAARLFDDQRKRAYLRMKLEGITDAPVNLCITCDRDRAGKTVLGRTHVLDTDLYSTVCAVQNLWLAARSEGIGVGWVSIYHEDRLKAVLGIPQQQVVVAYLCIGYVRELMPSPELAATGWRQRLDLAGLLHIDRWQCREGVASLEGALAEQRRILEERGCFVP
jgi:5,6-dimethylbenzimidazole synthase